MTHIYLIESLDSRYTKLHHPRFDPPLQKGMVDAKVVSYVLGYIGNAAKIRPHQVTGARENHDSILS
jgi:hypothetical protein